MYELKDRIWVCTKCNTVAMKKVIGNYRPRIRYKCLCTELNFTSAELEKSRGQVKNERCLEAYWVRARVIAVKGMDKEED